MSVRNDCSFENHHLYYLSHWQDLNTQSQFFIDVLRLLEARGPAQVTS